MKPLPDRPSCGSSVSSTTQSWRSEAQRATNKLLGILLSGHCSASGSHGERRQGWVHRLGSAQVTVDHHHLLWGSSRHNGTQTERPDGPVGRSVTRKGLISVTDVEKAAGLLSWISGVFGYIKPFNACLWGAIVEHRPNNALPSANKHPIHLKIPQAINCIQTRPELYSWFSIACRAARGRSHRRFHFGHGSCAAVRPTKGMDSHRVEQTRPQASCSNPRMSSLAGRVGATRHVYCLRHVDCASPGQVRRRHSERTPPQRCSTSNGCPAKRAEISLRLETHDISITQEHMPSVLSFECNRFTRLSQGA